MGIIAADNCKRSYHHYCWTSLGPNPFIHFAMIHFLLPTLFCPINAPAWISSNARQAAKKKDSLTTRQWGPWLLTVSAPKSCCCCFSPPPPVNLVHWAYYTMRPSYINLLLRLGRRFIAGPVLGNSWAAAVFIATIKKWKMLTQEGRLSSSIIIKGNEVFGHFWLPGCILGALVAGRASG